MFFFNVLGAFGEHLFSLSRFSGVLYVVFGEAR